MGSTIKSGPVEADSDPSPDAAFGKMMVMTRKRAGLLPYQCSPNQDSGRTGAWWRQLFLESDLFASISSLGMPYLALIGANDTTVSVADFQSYAPRIAQLKSGFEFAVLPGLDHTAIVTAPQTFQMMIKFINASRQPQRFTTLVARLLGRLVSISLLGSNSSPLTAKRGFRRPMQRSPGPCAASVLLPAN